MINLEPFPIMETDNLILRSMTKDDTDDIFLMRKDHRMHEYTDSKPDESIEDTKKYIENMINGVDEGKWIIWAIESKCTNKVIGTISIWNIDKEQMKAELGYGIIPDYQGKGLMKEALISVVDYGFNTMGLKLLDAYTEENNIKSNNLLSSCNFKVVDKIDEPGYFSERIYHMLVYRIEKHFS